MSFISSVAVSQADVHQGKTWYYLGKALEKLYQAYGEEARQSIADGRLYYLGLAEAQRENKALASAYFRKLIKSQPETLLGKLAAVQEWRIDRDHEIGELKGYTHRNEDPAVRAIAALAYALSGAHTLWKPLYDDLKNSSWPDANTNALASSMCELALLQDDLDAAYEFISQYSFEHPDYKFEYGTPGELKYYSIAFHDPNVFRQKAILSLYGALKQGVSLADSATCWYLIGDLDKARDCYETLIEFYVKEEREDPLYFEALLRLGGCAFLLGDSKAAQSYWDRAEQEASALSVPIFRMRIQMERLSLLTRLGWLLPTKQQIANMKAEFDRTYPYGLQYTRPNVRSHRYQHFGYFCLSLMEIYDKLHMAGEALREVEHNMWTVWKDLYERHPKRRNRHLDLLFRYVLAELALENYSRARPPLELFEQTLSLGNVFSGSIAYLAIRSKRTGGMTTE